MRWPARTGVSTIKAPAYAGATGAVSACATGAGAAIGAGGSSMGAGWRAGATGNTEARIFTLSMEAELVSIAGTYRTFESGLPKDLAKQPAQVRLAGDRIDILSIRV